MSRQEALTSSPNEAAMLEAFQQQTQEILNNRERYRKKGDKVPFGIEVEYGLVDDKMEQASESDRDSIIQDHSDYLDVELGAAQLEMRTEPIDLRQNPSIILDQLIERDEEIRASANSRGLQLLSHGTNPFVPVRGIVRSSHTKYQLVPNHHNDNQRESLKTIVGKPDRVDVGDAAIIGIANSVQANIEATDDVDAVDKLNRSFQIGPMVVSMFGNARFLETKDTGIQDIRMIGWEISHDTRSDEDVRAGEVTRVGLPADYYESLEDYFQQIEHYPFILNIPQAAIFVGIGLNWRDTRIKVVNDSLVVEFRPVSTQSTPEENYAAMMFYTGRLFWSQLNGEELLSMDQVVQNRNEAMQNGSQAKLWTNVNGRVKRLTAQEAMEYEIARAKEGLALAQIDDASVRDAMELLEAQRRGDNPSRYLAKLRNGYLRRGEQAVGALALALQDVKGMK